MGGHKKHESKKHKGGQVDLREQENYHLLAWGFFALLIIYVAFKA